MRVIWAARLSDAGGGDRQGLVCIAQLLDKLPCAFVCQMENFESRRGLRNSLRLLELFWEVDRLENLVMIVYVCTCIYNCKYFLGSEILSVCFLCIIAAAVAGVEEVSPYRFSILNQLNLTSLNLPYTSSQTMLPIMGSRSETHAFVLCIL